MLRSKIGGFSAVALVGFACILATEARATEGPLAQAQTAPLSCPNVPLGSGSLTVTAVPMGNPATFPHDVDCPGVGGKCSEYNYQFTAPNGNNFTKYYLSVSSDLNIYTVSPSATIESSACEGDNILPLIGRFVCEQRTIRFSSQPNSFPVSVIVSRSAARASTAGALTGLLQPGFCLIQGPGALTDTVTPLIARPTSSTICVAHGKCCMNVTYATDGGFTSAALVPGSICTDNTSDFAPQSGGQDWDPPPGGLLTLGHTKVWLYNSATKKWYSVCADQAC